MQYSPQQTAFIDWAVYGSGSCVLEAVAGAGKTTTILAAVKNMVGQVAILAYNKKIADEIKGKLQAAGIEWKKAQAGTVHSFGFSAYRKAFPKVKVNDKKMYEILDALVVNAPELKPFLGEVAKLVSLAKQSLVGFIHSRDDVSVWEGIIDHYDLFTYEPGSPVPPVHRLINLARRALQESVRMVETIDFDDMIYMPLVMRVRFWQYDVVMIDEAQDTNPARRALVRALLKKGGRVIAVGDRHQAIYGFTGADSDSLDLIANDFNCVQMPLTVSYRCPRKVVEFAQQWVSHIEAHESAPEGSVSMINIEDFMTRDDLNGEAAVLCRVTKPLVELAFKLIKNRIACRVEGREIGNGLKKLATRWKIKTLEALEKKLEEYLARETVKLQAKGKEVKLQMIEDQVDTLRVIIDQCRSEKLYGVDDLVAYIDDLFADDVESILVLSTIHKSKGREWDRVFWLDRAGTCPSKWARQKWQQEQEINLMYVAATRAKDQLIEVRV